MLQVSHLDVSKIDGVLHIGCAREAGESVSGPCVGNVRPRVGTGVVEWRLGGADPRMDARNGGEADYSHGRASGRPGASSAQIEKLTTTKSQLA